MGRFVEAIDCYHLSLFLTCLNDAEHYLAIANEVTNKGSDRSHSRLRCGRHCTDGAPVQHVFGSGQGTVA